MNSMTKWETYHQWPLSPKFGIKIGCNFPPSFWLKFLQFLTQVFPLHFVHSPL